MSQNFALHLLIQKFKIILPLDSFRFIEEESNKIHNFFKNKCFFEGEEEYFYATDAVKEYNKIRSKKIYVKDTDLMNIISLYFESYLPLTIEHAIEFLLTKQVWLDMYSYKLDLTYEECRRQEKLFGFVGYYHIDYEFLSSANKIKK